MTHALYTRQSLESLKLAELKAIASQIGVIPTDRRSIESHIVAILERQPQPVAAAEISTIQIAETAEAILDELEITFIDLSLSIGTDLVVPDGLDAYHAVYNDRVIIEVYNYKGGYVCCRGDGVVYDDPYSAMVNHYERYNPGAVLLARVAVDANREISQMDFTDNEKAILKGARVNEFSDAFAEPGNCPWVFSVIEYSGLDPKVARGAIASLVKKGVIEISDYEGDGKADDMILSATDLGMKIIDSALMPEYV
jgi:hypothetical protein